MSMRIAFPLLAVVLTVLVTVTGIASAGMMAPARGDVALQTFELAHGLSQGDLCGSEAGRDHHCPLCHGLPDVPSVGHAAIAYLLVPHEGWRQGDDLYRAAEARNINHSPRAPPVRA